MLKLVLVLCVVSATWAAEEAGAAEGTAIEKMRRQYLSRGDTGIKGLGR